MDEITEEDLNSIKYFWNEAGNPTCWIGWEKALPALRRQFPEIVAAWESYQTAIRTMTACVENAKLPGVENG